MTCLNCGRKLKSAASREAGYGPVCYKRLFGISMRISSKDNTSETTNIPYRTLSGQVTIEEYLQTFLK